MRIKLISLIVLYITSLLSSFAQVDTTWSLSRCVLEALENNPELRRSELQLRRDEINLRQARQNRLPNLNANVHHNLNQGRTIDPTTNLFIERTISAGGLSINSDVTLFSGFELLNEIRRRASAREAGKLEFEGMVNELKLDVITAYIQVWTAQDILVQSEQQFEVTKERLRNAKVLHREGEMAPGDYYDIKGEYNTNLNTIESNKQTLNNALLALSRLLATPITRIEQLQRPEVPSGYDVRQSAQLFDMARTQLPEYRAWQYRIGEAEHAIRVAKSDFYPTLRLGGGYNSFYSNATDLPFLDQVNNNLGRNIGLTLSIPIFNRFIVRNNVNRAKIELDDVRWQQEAALNQLREATAKTVFELETAQQMVKNLEEQEQSYQESFRVAQIQFDLGATNSVVYLTAKNKLENTQYQLVIKRYEWLLQKYVNDFYSGTMDL